MDHLEVKGSERALARALQWGTLRAVSDGSYKSKRGTAAVIVATKNLKHSITAKCQVTGCPEDQSAYRSEVMGILCGVQICNWLAAAHGVKKGKATHGCDGESALWLSFGDMALDPTKAQFDILSTVHLLRSQSGIEWATHHILGHQDKHLTWGQLDWWA